MFLVQPRRVTRGAAPRRTASDLPALPQPHHLPPPPHPPQVLVRVKAGDPITDKFITEMTKAFNSVKWLLFGDDKHEPVQDDAYQVARFSCRVSLLPLLVENLKARTHGAQPPC